MLFRQEAIDHHRGSLCGAMTLPVPVPLTVTTAFLAVCLAAFGVLLAAGTYTRKAHVAGFLAPHLGIARIVPTRAGTIVAVHVHDGQLVRAGDPLLTISAGEANDRGESVDGAVLENLRRQAARLGEQLALERRHAANQSEAAVAAIRRLEPLIASLQAEHALQAARSGIAERDMDATVALLARGEMSQVEARRRQDAYLAQRETESGMARAILDKQAELEHVRTEAADIPLESAQRLAVLQGSAADIDARMEALDGHRAYRLTAPMSGRVSSLQAWAGKAADPAMPQMSIVPEGDSMQAQLLVPARAVGFVKPGQHVRLSYDAFPYQQFGFADGTIETIARTLLKPGELSGPVAFDTPVFRVTVTLARQTMRAFGTDVPLQADTPLQADIMLDSRSLFAWVTDPLRAAAARS